MKCHKQRTTVLLAFIFFVVTSATGFNHWILKDGGKIEPQFDSPFYMQKPQDLIAFLNQTKYQEMIDTLYSELLLIKTDIRAKLGEVETHALGFLQQTKCMMKYFLDEGDLLASIGSRKVMDRVYLEGDAVLEMFASEEAANMEPICADYLDSYPLFCFEHLHALHNPDLKMDPEDPLKLHELGIINENFANQLVTGLRRDPQRWQLYTLSSYYWRLKGDAFQAVECARRALHLVPRSHKDIPLLSLGTILQRSRQHRDAVIVLEAATDLNPRSAENHFALANSLFFLSEFNRSLQEYKRAKHLDDAFNARVDYIENALLCFKHAKTRLDFDALLGEISSPLRRYEERKAQLEEYLKKMLQQQVPLDEREYFKRRSSDGDGDLEELAQQRGQYCSTRVSDTNEPVLFCDFVYDIHMKLESDDIRVDVINTYLEQTADVMRTAKSSLGVFDRLDLNKLVEQDEEIASSSVL